MRLNKKNVWERRIEQPDAMIKSPETMASKKVVKNKDNKLIPFFIGSMVAIFFTVFFHVAYAIYPALFMAGWLMVRFTYGNENDEWGKLRRISRIHDQSGLNS